MTPVRLLGAAITLICALIFGNEKCKREKMSIELLLGLVALVRYTGEQISVFRMPLFRIYSSFSNKALEKVGFISHLKSDDLKGAIDSVSGILSESTVAEVSRFFSELGRGYEKGQSELCSLTVSRLSKILDLKREKLSEKLKMYRLLPILIAGSVIILLL